MKYLAIALLFLASTVAQAHVLLTTPYSVTGPLGVTTCSAPHATMTSSAPIYGSGGALVAISITYSLGTATFTGSTDTAFTVAACAPTYTNVLNLSTGTWTLTLNGVGTVASNTLTGAQLSSAITTYSGAATALRDSADQFLTISGTGLLTTPLGTQPATW